MTTLLRAVATALLLFSLGQSLRAQPAIITQGASDTFLAFEAEHYASVQNESPTSWLVVADLPASGTPASGGRALYQSGEPQNTTKSSSFALYSLRFSTPGTYSLYVRWRGDKARTDQDGNGGNSYRRPSDFGDLANDDTSSLFPVSSANNSRVPPDANQYASIKEGATYTVTQEQVDAGIPLVFKIGTREWGMFLDRFVFSLDASLTEADINATPNSETSIIVQGAADDFVAFEAERFGALLNASPTAWELRDDAPASGTPASGGRALYQSGEPQNTTKSSSFALYSLRFSTPGTYSLYVRWRGDKARTDQDGNGGNSYRRPSDFGDLANDDTSSLFPVSSANNSRVPPDANQYASIKEGATYTVTQEQVDAGIPLVFKIGTREWGMFLDRFVFSLNASLTEGDINAIPNSGSSSRPTLDKAVGSAGLNSVSITFSKPLAPASADPSLFTFNGGITALSASLDPLDPKVVRVETSPQTEGAVYTVTVSGVISVDGGEILPGSKGDFSAWKLVKGWLRREFYYTVTGATLDTLQNSPKFPGSPDSVDLVRSFAFENSPWADNYGVRFTTFFIPLTTDSYDFYAYSDDQAQVLLSADETELGLQPLLDSPCCSDTFAAGVVGRSPSVLQAGKRYFLRALLKQGTAEVRFNLAARPASESGEPVELLRSLGGEQIGTLVNPNQGSIHFDEQPQAVTARPGTRARFSVKAGLGGAVAFYQWQLNGNDIPGANRSVYQTPLLSPADNGRRYRVVVSVAGVSSASAEALLTVSGPEVFSDVKPYIGVNFTGGGTGGAAGVLLPDDVAGIIAQDHFNNARGANGADLSLMDSTGAPTSVTLDYNSAAISYTGTGEADGDRLLYQGYIHNNNTAPVVLTLRGVPEGLYNLYVYGLGFNFNSVFDQDYSLTSLEPTPDLYITAQHAGDYAASSTFVRASSTEADTRAKGNYVAFERIRPDPSGELVLTVTPKATIAGINYMPAVNAFQLASVQVRPTLTVTAQGGITLSWEATAAGFQLESSASLGGAKPAEWKPVGGVLSGAGSLNIPTPSGSVFYRLRQ